MTAPLLPHNATPLERDIEAVQTRLGEVPVGLTDIWDPQTCPLALLPWLAWALSIDTWDSSWPEAVKRNRVAVAIAVQRRKGTTASVRDVVDAYGGDIEVREWWETTPAGTPHTFALTIFGGQAGLVDAVIEDVSKTKPLRSHFTFTQALEASGSIGVVGAFRPVAYLRCNGLGTPS